MLPPRPVPGWGRAFIVLLFLFQLHAHAEVSTFCASEREQALKAARRIDREWPLFGHGDIPSVYIRTLGERLARSTAQGRVVPWHFQVVRDRAANAYWIGGGFIYVTEGALNLVQTESEIAAILAHEMGHQLAGHLCQAPPTLWESFWSLMGDWSTPESSREVRRQGVGSLTQAIDIAKELEADRLAVQILDRAGYDPRAVLTVARRLPAGDGFHRLRDERRICALEGLLVGTSPRSEKGSKELRRVKRELASQ
jgi:beta-barrel assembly-enhancing protease